MISLRRYISTIAVIGAGQMGAGIAYTAARAGLTVILSDTTEAALDNAKNKLIKNAIGYDMHKENIDDPEPILAKMTYSTDMAALKNAEFVIEAIVESEQVKEACFNAISATVGPDTIIASNTSSISITKLATFTDDPTKFIGTHFFNPPPRMKLLEVIEGARTSEETVKKTMELAKVMDKTAVKSIDRPGFVVNRILVPFMNEAFNVLNENIASAEDIDTAMKLGLNLKMGPLMLADFVGLDTCLSVMRVFHKEFGDSKYRPAPNLVNYVNAGLLGVKTGRGVYDYTKK